MPWEHIGEVGAGQWPNEREWVLAELELGILYLKNVCGESPDGCELDIMWHEHDLGDYPTNGLLWGAPETLSTYPPDDYIERCQFALDVFDKAVDWAGIHPTAIQSRLKHELHEETSGEEDNLD